MLSSTDDQEKNEKYINNKYAVYISNVNRRHLNLEQKTSIENSKLSNIEQEKDESSVCLSLLETNLEATQETVVRCHLMKTFSALEATGFENEGKFAVLSDESKEFGCYYHHLVKVSSSTKSLVNESSVEMGDNSSKEETETKPKKTSFFICLIGLNSELMESFCYEFGIFCLSLLPILDPEVQESCKLMQDKLPNWYTCCIEYAKRCIEKFGSNLVVLFQATLCGKVVIDCQDESLNWDLCRFADACSINTLLQINSNTTSSSTQKNSDSDTIIQITVKDDTLCTSQTLNESHYCQIWVDKLLSCNFSEHQLIRNILENFRLKTVQDLNTLKRLLKKAESDYYSLYKAYQFLEASNYANILLYHVREEAILTCNEEALNIIKCLKDFIEYNHQTS